MPKPDGKPSTRRKLAPDARLATGLGTGLATCSGRRRPKQAQGLIGSRPRSDKGPGKRNHSIGGGRPVVVMAASGTLSEPRLAATLVPPPRAADA